MITRITLLLVCFLSGLFSENANVFATHVISSGAGLHLNISSQKVSAYPNPSVKDFTLEIGLSSTEEVQVKIFDINGMTLNNNSYSIQGFNSMNLNLKGMNTGIYFLEVRFSDLLKKVIRRVKI